jgi:SAM-dependent methyltransferase
MPTSPHPVTPRLAGPPSPADEAAGLAPRLLDIANSGALCLAISIGHRAGLFDALARLEAGGTADDVAGEAGLEPRYVREWLGAVASGGLVELMAGGDRYRLPKGHARLLSRRGAPGNLAGMMQWIPLIAGVEDRLLGCFREGGGLGYEAYPRFHEIMAELSGQTVVAHLFDAILPLDPELVPRLRCGLDLLDVGCGQGRAVLAMASEFPSSRFHGLDISHDAVGRARAEAREMGLHNVRFSVGDAALLDAPASYDVVTAFDAIHDQAEPERVLANIRRTLRPGGLFLMQDIATHSDIADNLDHPLGPFLYTLSFGHSLSVSLARGGAGLGACWGRRRAETLLGAAGFTQRERHALDHDVLNDVYLLRP